MVYTNLVFLIGLALISMIGRCSTSTPVRRAILSPPNHQEINLSVERGSHIRPVVDTSGKIMNHGHIGKEINAKPSITSPKPYVHHFEEEELMEAKEHKRRPPKNKEKKHKFEPDPEDTHKKKKKRRFDKHRGPVPPFNLHVPNQYKPKQLGSLQHDM